MIRYWALDYSRWVHTSQIVHMTYMLVHMVSAIGGAESSTPKKLSDFNPYDVGSVDNEGQITPQNFKVLQKMFDAYMDQSRG